MKFDDFLSLTGISSECSNQEIADLTGFSLRSVYNYQDEGVPLEKVEAACSKLGFTLKVVLERQNISEVEKDSLKAMEKKFFKKIGEECVQSLTTASTIYNMLKENFDISMKDIQEVVEGKCRDIHKVHLVSTCCNIDWIFNEVPKIDTGKEGIDYRPRFFGNSYLESL